jgi:hypothetical protein
MPSIKSILTSVPGIVLGILAFVWAVKSYWEAEMANRLSMMESCRDHPVSKPSNQSHAQPDTDVSY